MMQRKAGVLGLPDNLESAYSDYLDAKETLMQEIATTQKHCSHPQILHAEAVFSSSLLPLRICVCCGLEEEGSSWATTGYWSTPYLGEKLGNTPERLVLAVTRDELYNHRLPGPRTLANDMPS